MFQKFKIEVGRDSWGGVGWGDYKSSSRQLSIYSRSRFSLERSRLGRVQTATRLQLVSSQIGRNRLLESGL